MFKTVRSRLFASYALVIVFSLGAIGLLLSVVLIPRVQSQLIFGGLQLAHPPAVFHVRAEMLRAFRDLGRDQVIPALRQTVAEMGRQRDVRVLVLTGRYVVLVDSEGTLEGQLFPRVNPSPDRRQGPLPQGKYRTPDGQELLWVGGPFDLLDQEGSETRQRFILVLAQTPRDHSALSNLLRSQFLVGGLAGLALALALAFLVARSIARPLQRVAVAAEEVARGNYDLGLDITSPEEVKSVAASFNAMTQAVKASQQAQRDFVANVSHELRTPLTSIQGFSQAILDGTASDPESIRQAAGVVHDEAGRMGRMVEQLLDLAKIEAGQIVMAREAVDLGAVLESCVEKLTPQAVRGDVLLAAGLNRLPPDVRVTGDGDRLAQVFIVLLDNALKHTPGGGKVAVTAETFEASQVEVSVSDTGPGIPAGDLPRIFERFYQVDKSRTRGRGGAGLGLSIAREIVAAHGGEIAAESIVGVGSKFTVRLPMARSAASEGSWPKL
jgi:two-component system OmpR family sensor kinase